MPRHFYDYLFVYFMRLSCFVCWLAGWLCVCVCACIILNLLRTLFSRCTLCNRSAQQNVHSFQYFSFFRWEAGSQWSAFTLFKWILYIYICIYTIDRRNCGHSREIQNRIGIVTDKINTNQLHHDTKLVFRWNVHADVGTTISSVSLSKKDRDGQS